MSQYIFIGTNLTLPLLRDYIITHKVNPGDIIILNPKDFEDIIHEIKNSDGAIPDFPLKMLGVLIEQDHNLNIPVGKIQIVNAEKQY